MTTLLADAIHKTQLLPPREQEAIAAHILELLDDERAWAPRLEALPSRILDLSDAAVEEHRRGETRPLDELIG